MKIYVASSWRNLIQPAVVAMLRTNGHEVYDFKNPPARTGFAWAQIDPNWQTWTPEQYEAALEHPLAVAGFQSDLEGLDRADMTVLVMPCGRSAHTELGYAIGQGQHTVIFMPTVGEQELMYALADRRVYSLDALIAYVEEVEQAREESIRKASGVYLRREEFSDYDFDNSDEDLELETYRGGAQD